MNIGAIGGTFLSQTATGILVDFVGRLPGGGYPPEAYRAVFGALAVCAVRCKCCIAISRWRRGIAALLGRFLPKLRAAGNSGLFSCLKTAKL
jgi:hypothetical protein